MCVHNFALPVWRDYRNYWRSAPLTSIDGVEGMQQIELTGQGFADGESLLEALAHARNQSIVAVGCIALACTPAARS